MERASSKMDDSRLDRLPVIGQRAGQSVGIQAQISLL
jgi:hypothetical protein